MPSRFPTRRHRCVRAWVIAAVVWLAASNIDPALAQDADGVEVITSPDRADMPLERGFLRAVFTMRMRAWPDGKPVKVFVLPDDSDAHRRFCNEVLGIFPYRLRDGWDRAVFTGTGMAPRMVDSIREMETSVRQTPGAIGYVIRGGGS